MNVAGPVLPAPERAFPIGWHDRLIKAAIDPDATRALGHAHAWLLANDIDTAPFRDHRLLVAVAARFGPLLARHGAYPRLVGLRRMLWTRSLMALREAKPTLAAIADAGVEMMLFKGAARLADGSHVRGERVAHDIDIAVRPEQIRTAFDILIERGWLPSQGVSHRYIREQLDAVRSVNMFNGNFGDIDLHARLFHPSQGGPREDVALWTRSRPGLLDGVAVRLPSPEDGLALSIAHGALDAHAHSDWLVDAAHALSQNAIDWLSFGDIVEGRSLHAPVLIALSYLQSNAGLPVPAATLAALSTAVREKPLAYLLTFAEARPRDRASAIGNILRGTAKLLRKRAARRKSPYPRDRLLGVRWSAHGQAAESSALALERDIAVPPEFRDGPAYLRAILQIVVPPARRRIELEVNATDRHICRIRYRKWSRRAHLLTLAVEGPIGTLRGDATIKLVSRPSRLLRHYSASAEKARYDALPFRISVLEFSRMPGTKA